MKTLLKGLFLSCVVLALTGCGVTGKWTMQSIEPESAKAHFNLQKMCLMDDGTYMACVKEGDQCKCLKGNYTYDASAKTLTFRDDGKERQYHAEVTGCCGSQMKISGGEKGKEWTAMMKHEGACPKGKCCCGGKGCDGAKCAQACDAKKGDKKCEPAKCPAAKKDAPPEGKKAEPAKGEQKK
jgi:hypothetical protein